MEKENKILPNKDDYNQVIIKGQEKELKKYISTNQKKKDKIMKYNEIKNDIDYCFTHFL